MFNPDSFKKLNSLAKSLEDSIPKIKMPEIPTFSIPEIPTLSAIDPALFEIVDPSQAETQFKIIMDTIKQFEVRIDDEHEVAIKVTMLGGTNMFSISEIDFFEPSTIHYKGWVNGQPAELLQHVSQMNFLLLAVPKAVPEKPKAAIGFRYYKDKCAEN